MNSIPAGLNCPELLMEYQRVIQGVCSDSALPSIPSVFTTIKDMIGDVSVFGNALLKALTRVSH
eukprot:1146700-Pelagomonas_calceolata.AAC.4